MKRALIFCMAALLVLSIATDTSASANTNIKLTLFLNENVLLVEQEGFTEELSLSTAPCNPHGRTLVPIRGVLEAFGAKVEWLAKTKQVKVVTSSANVLLTLNDSIATVGTERIVLDEPAQLINGRTMIPLRFVSEALGYNVKWYSGDKRIVIEGKRCTVAASEDSGTEQTPSQAFHLTRQLTIDGTKRTINIVEIPKSSKLRPIIGIGKGYVGGVEELASMAQRTNAVAAINGSYFEAYTEPHEPWGTLICDGEFVHIGNVGSCIGFNADGEIKMDTLRVKIEGATNGSYAWPNNWYAYNFNRTPSPYGSAVYIYTHHRGETLGFAYGTSVTVEDGIVTQVEHNVDADIPSNGFVVNFTGSEVSLAARLEVGKTVEYRLVHKDAFYTPIDWNDITTAVGAGPTLVKDGEIVVDPFMEGFEDEKITTKSWNRSAIGIKSDGSIILVTTPGLKIEQLAQVMQMLGAVDAINMDSGASSGLYLNGKYITKPGRLLSNALLFVEEEN